MFTHIALIHTNTQTYIHARTHKQARNGHFFSFSLLFGFGYKEGVAKWQAENSIKKSRWKRKHNNNNKAKQQKTYPKRIKLTDIDGGESSLCVYFHSIVTLVGLNIRFFSFFPDVVVVVFSLFIFILCLALNVKY